MQRAAASAASSPTTNDPSTPNRDGEEDFPSPRPSKRARTSLDSNHSHSHFSTPGTPRVGGGNAEIQSALAAEEEARKAEALARVAAERGETKWALAVAPGVVREEGNRRVVVGGWSLGDIERMDTVETGRRRFGILKKKEQHVNGNGEGSADSTSEDEEDMDVEELIEKGRKEAARAEGKGVRRDGKHSSRDKGPDRKGSHRGKKRKSAG